ncbi:MAG: class I SAM-dependent methyltransferase [Alphaproteobacteria bacterium]
MSGFSADWLALRAPFDDAARARSLARRFVALLPAAPRLVDLGAGTGAARRAVGPLLGAGARWTLVDADTTLLQHVSRLGCIVRNININRSLETIFDVDYDGVTAFALLDLGGDGWLGRLAQAVAARAIPFYAPLIVDGRTEWTPGDPDDAIVLRAFAGHQRRRKGLGLAAGPRAPAAAAAAFRRAGYRVAVAPSDWRVPPGAGAMLAAMIDGAEHAAGEQAPGERARIAAWAARRRRAASDGRLALTVGHVDLLAWHPRNGSDRRPVSLRTATVEGVR